MSEALAITDDADLFENPDFTNAVQERTKRRAKAFFHGRGFDRLVEMAEAEDVRTALSAITLLGKLAGEFKAPPPIHFSFEQLINRTAAEPGPLSGITRIVPSEVIDAEEPEEEHDEL